MGITGGPVLTYNLSIIIITERAHRFHIQPISIEQKSKKEMGHKQPRIGGGGGGGGQIRMSEVHNLSSANNRESRQEMGRKAAKHDEEDKHQQIRMGRRCLQSDGEGR